MQIVKTQHEVTSNGVKDTIQCSVDNSPKLFKLITSKLYKNPIGSIVREIVTNAIDAHIEAGVADKKPIVHLPSELEPYFSVQDFGTGMSPERVRNVFGVLAKSTKDCANEENGGFGLGSKTPLAYTNQYTIVTVHNGTKYHYVVHFDNNDMLVIDLLNSAPTNEGNGTTVTIAVESDDYYRFEKEMNLQVYMAAKVKVKNTHHIKNELWPEILEETDDYVIIKAGHGRANNTILVGDVVYSLGYSIRNLVGKRDFSSAVAAHYLIPKFPIGSLEMAPTREDIIANPENVATIREKFDKVASLVADAWEKSKVEYERQVAAFKKKFAPGMFKAIKARDFEWFGGFVNNLSELARYSDIVCKFNDGCLLANFTKESLGDIEFRSSEGEIESLYKTSGISVKVEKFSLKSSSHMTIKVKAENHTLMKQLNVQISWSNKVNDGGVIVDGIVRVNTESHPSTLAPYTLVVVANTKTLHPFADTEEYLKGKRHFKPFMEFMESNFSPFWIEECSFDNFNDIVHDLQVMGELAGVEAGNFKDFDDVYAEFLKWYADKKPVKGKGSGMKHTRLAVASMYFNRGGYGKPILFDQKKVVTQTDILYFKEREKIVVIVDGVSDFGGDGSAFTMETINNMRANPISELVDSRSTLFKHHALRHNLDNIVILVTPDYSKEGFLQDAVKEHENIMTLGQFTKAVKSAEQAIMKKTVRRDIERYGVLRDIVLPVFSQMLLKLNHAPNTAGVNHIFGDFEFCATVHQYSVYVNTETAPNQSNILPKQLEAAIHRYIKEAHALNEKLGNMKVGRVFSVRASELIDVRCHNPQTVQHLDKLDGSGETLKLYNTLARAMKSARIQDDTILNRAKKHSMEAAMKFYREHIAPLLKN